MESNWIGLILTRIPWPSMGLVQSRVFEITGSLLVLCPAAAGMEDRVLWRMPTAWLTTLSTDWRCSAHKGALQSGCYSLDTSLTRYSINHWQSSAPTTANPWQSTEFGDWIHLTKDSTDCNNQFCLVTQLCLLLCFTFKDDFAQNREFITLVVYKTDGKKVYYPSEYLLRQLHQVGQGLYKSVLGTHCVFRFLSQPMWW